MENFTEERARLSEGGRQKEINGGLGEMGGGGYNIQLSD